MIKNLLTKIVSPKVLLWGTGIMLVVALLTGIFYYKEVSEHSKTKNELTAVRQSLDAAERQLKRVEMDREISDSVKNELHEELATRERDMVAIKKEADAKVEEILREYRQKQKEALAACSADDPLDNGGKTHEDLEKDVGRRVADALVTGMWNVYEKSLRDKTDSSR